MYFYLVLVLFTWLAFKGFWIIWRYIKSCRQVATLPKFYPQNWFWGTFYRISDSDDYLRLFHQYVVKERPKLFCGWTFFLYPGVHPVHPATLRDVLAATDVPKNHGVAGPYRMFKPWIGDGLLVSGGKKWERNRRLLTPAFHFDILKGYIADFNSVADNFISRLRELAGNGESFDVFPPVSRATLDTMLRCTVSYNDDTVQNIQDNHPYVAVINRLTHLLIRRTLTPLHFFDWIYNHSSNGREFARLSSYVHNFSSDIIQKRRHELENDSSLSRKRHLDFLDTLLTATDDNGQGLSDQEIRDEVDTFMFEADDIELLHIVAACDVPHDDTVNIDDLLAAFRTKPQIKVLELLNEILTHHEVSVRDIRDARGSTLLHLAAEKNYINIAETLLEHNLDILEENEDGQLALDVALKDWNREYDNITALMLQYLDNASVRDLFTRQGPEPPRLSLHSLIKRKFEVSAVLGSLAEPAEDGATDVFYDILESDKDGYLPMEREGIFNRRYTAYQHIALQGSIDMVNHDIVRLLTSAKWQTFAKRRFSVQALIYLFIVFALTFVAVTSVNCADVMIYDTPLQYARAVFELISYTCVAMKFVSELRQLIREKKRYFTDFVNIIELLASSALLCVLPLRLLHEVSHWYVFAVGYILWIHIIYKYAAIFRTTGVQAQILWTILHTDVIQFSMLFVVINLAFSGCFLLVLKGDSGLSVNSETSSFFDILLFGLRTLIEGESVLEYTEGYKTMSIIVILAFLFVTIVILLNILIAQLSDTYQKIAADADRNYEVNVARIIAWMEINDWSCKGCKNVQSEFYKPFEHIQDMNTRLDIRKLTLLEEISQLAKILVRKQVAHDLHMLTVKSEVKRMQGSVSAIKMGQPTINQALREVRGEIDGISKDVSELRDFPELVQNSVYGIGEEIMELKRMANRILEEIRRLRQRPSDGHRLAMASRDADTLPFVVMKQAREEMLLRENIPDLERYAIKHQTRFTHSVWFDHLTNLPQHEVLAHLNNEYRQGSMVGDYKFDDGDTPLHIAAKRGHYFVVEKLIDMKVDLLERNANDKIALQVALDNGMDNIAALLTRRIDKTEARGLFLATKNEKPMIKLSDYFSETFSTFVEAALDGLVEQDTVYYNMLEADNTGHLPDDAKFSPGEGTVFQSLAHWGDKTAINHVIVRLLILKKWNGYARKQFMFYLVLYLATLFSITFAAVEAVHADDVRYYNSSRDIMRVIFEILGLVLVALAFVIEIREFFRNKLRHLRDPFNWLEGGSALTLIAIPVVRYINVQVHWYMFASGYFLWSIIIFKYAAIFRQTGAYAQILWHIVRRDIVQFSVLFAVINLAFSGSFFLVLKGDDNLQINTETSSFFGIMFVGLRTMTEGEPVISYTGPEGYRSASVVMILLFLFVTIVILLNILIAQLSDTYTKIQGDAKRELEVRMAKIISRIERTPLPCCGQNAIRSNYVQSQSTKEISSKAGLGACDMDIILKDMHYVAEKQVTNQLNTLALKDETVKCKNEVKDLTKTTKQQTEETSKVKSEVSNLGLSVTALTVEMKHTYQKFTKNMRSFHKEFQGVATTLEGVQDAVRSIRRRPR